MDDEIQMESQGETAEVQAVASSGSEMETVLIFMTSMFLVLATLLLATQLYSTYHLFGKPEEKARMRP